MREQILYSNGVGQNCVFMRHSFEAAGYDVDFVTNKRYRTVSSDLPYEMKEFEKLDLDEYCLFIFGSQTLLKQYNDKVHAKGIRRVMFNPCNTLDAFHMENFLYSEKKEQTPLFEMTFHDFCDEVWVTSNHNETTLEYLNVILLYP